MSMSRLKHVAYLYVHFEPDLNMSNGIDDQMKLCYFMLQLRHDKNVSNKENNVTHEEVR